MDEIWEAFSQLSEVEFKAKYGFSKPSTSTNLLATQCLKGIKAQVAMDKLNLLGYQNVAIYNFADWKEKGGEVMVTTIRDWCKITFAKQYRNE